MMIASGVLKQELTVNSFLGRAVEEKFHMRPLSLSIIPCIPLVSEVLKDMIHPDVAPVEFSKGEKEGYFYVNLSLDQDFDMQPEFFEADTFGDGFGMCIQYMMQLAC